MASRSTPSLLIPTPPEMTPLSLRLDCTYRALFGEGRIIVAIEWSRCILPRPCLSSSLVPFVSPAQDWDSTYVTSTATLTWYCRTARLGDALWLEIRPTRFFYLDSPSMLDNLLCKISTRC